MSEAQSEGDAVNNHLLGYYEALEKASTDMLSAARQADWDQVVRLEGACVLLIAQLKHAAGQACLAADEAKLKTRLMQRILINDAEIRTLAEPWLEDLDRMLAGKARTLH
jgi:flagellar protein FliT